MRVEHRGRGRGREVLVGMIVSDPVLAAVAARWGEGGLFPSRWENLVGGWCVRHFRKYGKAPGADVESVFDRWAEDPRRDPDTVKLVESFLSGLSGEYARRKKAANPDYLIDRAAEFFTLARQTALKDEVGALVQAGDWGKVDALLRDYRKVELGAEGWFDPLHDKSVVKAAFESRGEVLFRFGQPALDDFFGDTFERDTFTVFWSGEKTGKSFFLQKIVLQALLAGRRTAYMHLGDMSEHQIVRRLAAQAARRPFKADKRVRLPTSIESGDPPEVTYDDRGFPEPMSADDANKWLGKLGKKIGRGMFRVSCRPNMSTSIDDVESTITAWDRQDGWVVDALILDYIDLLAPLDGRAETRDQIDVTWKKARGLSQKLHCAVVTASQANAGSYKTRLLSRVNFSNSKTKLAHPTATIGINQTAPEKEAQVYRLNHIATRELEFSETKCVYLASCLAVADAMVLSTF
jgi:hypothetical protein